MKIVFFGTPAFAGEILEYLIDNKVNIVAVVTQSDKSRGNTSQVKEISERKLPEIRVFQPEKATDPSFIEALRKYEPDLFVVVAYGKILRQNLLDIPLKGAINVHASLLPKYRGAAPIQRALWAGEPNTGISIMMMTAGLDSGDVIATEEVEIDEAMNFEQLEKKLCSVAKPLLLEVLKNFEKGKVTLNPQKEYLASYAAKISAPDLNINFNQAAYAVHNQIRALSPVPGARCSMKINGLIKSVKILESAVVFKKGKAKEVLAFTKEDFIVACEKNAIAIKRLQIEGKKIVSTAEFIRGIKSQIEILEA